MSSTSSGSPREEQYRYDDSIFKPRNETRVELPTEDTFPFEETQPFDQIWLWALLGLELLVVLVPLILSAQPWWTFILAVAAMVLSMALLGSLKLYTRIDIDGIHYRMKPFHWKERTIYWDEIDQVYVRKYSPILEYGGWGMRYRWKSRAFNVKGNYGIQVVKKNGTKILLGTQQPDEVGYYLGRHPLLV